MGTESRSATAADLNGDGLLDLATGTQDAASRPVLMDTTAPARPGFGFSHVELGTPLHQWGGTDEVWPADFNRDGRLDFAVIADNQMRVAVLLTNGATVTLPTQGIDAVRGGRREWGRHRGRGRRCRRAARAHASWRRARRVHRLPDDALARGWRRVVAR